MKCGQKYSECIMGHLYLVWVWRGGWAATLIPQQWKRAFVRDRESSRAEKNDAAPGGEVCTHDVAAPVPYPCTKQTGMSHRDVNCLLWVTLVRGQIVSCMLQVLCEEMGVLQICLLRSSSRFPLILWCFIGNVAERRKLLLNSKGGRSRKGM